MSQMMEIRKNAVCLRGSGIFIKDRCRAAENVTELRLEEGVFHGTIVVFCTSKLLLQKKKEKKEKHNSDWLNGSQSVYCFTNLEIPY